MRTRCYSLLYLLAAVVVAWALGVSTSVAQTAASISGVVSDNTDAVLPGVTVTATSVETGTVRTAVTNARGRYQLSNLQVGDHELRAELSGFRPEIRRGIRLTVGQAASVDFVLQIGDLAEEVVVSGEAAAVEHTVSDLASVVTTEQIESLPMNARDLSKLFTLNVGVSHYRHAGGSNTSGYGSRMSVSGARVLQNSFTLDGTEITGPQGGTPGGVTGGIMGVDTIREFKVLTNTFSAQYGRAAGANIVALTRSGTNEFHGSTLWYHRNDNLDARNFFDGEEAPEFRRNQYGFSLGGPIIRDRTFIFGSFEGLRERLGRTESVRVPSAAAREGILPSGNVEVAPEVRPYLDLWPLPNGGDLGDGVGLYVGETSQPTDQDYLSVRVDHRLSKNHSFFARYLYDDSARIDPSLIDLVRSAVDIRNQYFTLEQMSVFSSNLVGRLQIGFNRSLDDNSDRVPNEVAGRPAVDLFDPNLVFLSGRPIGILIVSGIEGISGVDEFRSHTLNSYQYSYDLDYLRGSHSLKFGASVNREIYHRTADRRLGGEWEFGSFSDFLQNRPGNFRIQGPVAEASRTLFQTSFGFYVQDDWAVRPNLTLNMGIRYEFQTVPREKWGRITNLRSPFDAEYTPGDPLWNNPSTRNISPRLGFVWDPFGDGRTSVRGGAGVFWEHLGMKTVMTQIFGGPPFYTDINPLPEQLPGMFPNVDAMIDELAGGAIASHAVDPFLKNPYAVKWNLSFQRELWPQTVLTAAYVGSRGAHLISRFEYTRPQAIQLDDGRWFYPPDAPLINSNFARNEWYTTGSSSHYHAMQLELERRLSAGLRAGVAYTLGKSTDTSSSHWQGEAGDTRIMSPWDIRLDRALSNFDVRHSLIVDFGYELPFGQELAGVSGALAKGWQVTGILQATSGNPITITSDRRLTHPLIFAGGRPDLVQGASNNPVLGGPDQYFDPTAFAPQQTGFYGTLGRNTLIGPGMLNLDLSVVKNFHIRDSQNVQFRVEVFNLFNRANFSQPSTEVFDRQGMPIAGAGRISSTSTTARQIQLALRYEF